jgi:hypothetical protein
MQKWEYIRGKNLSDHALEEAGRLGWELVDFVVSRYDEELYVFKRPLEEPDSKTSSLKASESSGTFDLQLSPEQWRKLSAFILDLTHYQRRGLPEPDSEASSLQTAETRRPFEWPDVSCDHPAAK